MADFRRVTDSFWVSPQLDLVDLDAVKAQGFTTIINNRPDGEAPDQPAGAQVEAAALALGLGYVAAPVSGRPSAEAVARVRETVDAAPGKVLAFCRSGTRSIFTWAMGQASSGADREALIAAGRAAGYDLTQVI